MVELDQPQEKEEKILPEVVDEHARSYITAIETTLLQIPGYMTEVLAREEERSSAKSPHIIRFTVGTDRYTLSRSVQSGLKSLTLSRRTLQEGEIPEQLPSQNMDRLNPYATGFNNVVEGIVFEGEQWDERIMLQSSMGRDVGYNRQEEKPLVLHIHKDEMQEAYKYVRKKDAWHWKRNVPAVLPEIERMIGQLGQSASGEHQQMSK